MSGNYIYSRKYDEFGSLQWPAFSVATATEAAATPASNLAEYDRPYRIYRGTGAWGSEHVTLDMGATTSLKLLFLDYPNVVIWTIYGNATDSWGAPSYASDPIAATFCQESNRYKLTVDLRGTSFESTGYRYLRAVPTGGALGSVLELGSITPIASLTEFVENPGFPLDKEPRLEVDIRALPTGQIDSTVLGGHHAEITIDSEINSPLLDTDMLALMAYGVGRPLFFWRNFGNVGEAYMCSRTIGAKYTLAGPVERTFTPIVLREVS